MKIFITGGTGNIGQYVTKQLAERGHEVLALTRTPDKVPGIRALKNVTLIKGDTGELEIMGRAVQGCDAVVYIARGWGNPPSEMLENDNKSVVYLLQKAEEAGVKQFVYTSSTAAYGKNYVDGMDEDTTVLRPQNLYGVAKATNEMFVLGWHQKYLSPEEKGKVSDQVRIKRNVIRPGYTIATPPWEGGAVQGDARIGNICRSVLRNEDLFISEWDATPFLDSSQIAQVYVKVVESNLNEEVFLALGKENTSWAQIARWAIEMAPESKSRVLPPPDEKPKAPVYINVDKIKRFFGFSFDSTEFVKANIKWHLDRERLVLAGRELPKASTR
jgi:UDP-glucose 4-epimerase